MINHKRILFIVPLIFLSVQGCVGRTVIYDSDPGIIVHKPAEPKQEIKKEEVIRPSAPEIIKPVDIDQQSLAEYQKFIRSHNKGLSSDTVENIAVTVVKYSNEFKVDPKYIFALIARESSFRATVVSSSGAIGMGQLLASTAKDMGISDPYNPDQNILATTKLLSLHLKKWDGSIDLALASYKMGAYGVETLLKSGRDLPWATKKYILDIKDYYKQI